MVLGGILEGRGGERNGGHYSGSPSQSTSLIADAMKYLHYSSVIHRDLATRNIMLFSIC